MPTPRTRPRTTTPPDPGPPEPAAPEPAVSEPAVSEPAVSEPAVAVAPPDGPASGPLTPEIHTPTTDTMTTDTMTTSTTIDPRNAPVPATGSVPSAPPDGRHATGSPDAAGTTTQAVSSVVGESAHDRVWAALRSHPGSTVADLSMASRVSRATVGKLLAEWSTDGSATSAAGPARRAARVWTAAPSDLPDLPGLPSDPNMANSRPPSASDDAATGPKPTDPTSTGHQPAGAASDGAAPSCGEAPGSGATAGSALRARITNGTPTVNRSGSPRLGAGALQGLVEDYLAEHPGEHGSTAIGAALGRSSGAVANALDRLVAAGAAVQTRDKPKRYRAVEQPDPAPDDAPEEGGPDDDGPADAPAATDAASASAG